MRQEILNDEQNRNQLQSQLQPYPQSPQQNFSVGNQSDKLYCKSFIMGRLLEVLRNNYKKDTPAQLKKRILSTFDEGKILT